MSDDRSTTTVRVPTARLLPAVTAAMEAHRRERWAEVNKAVATEMALPVPTGWWGRRSGRQPAKTRDEAIERVKATRDTFPSWSLWDEIWWVGRGERAKLQALKDACELRLDHVDVAADDVALFKAFYEHREAYR